MKVKYIMIIAFSLLMISFNGYAQPEGGVIDRMEALKVSFITKKLQLNTEEAKLFWPVYNEYDAEKNDLRKQKRALFGELKEGEGNESEMDTNVGSLMELKIKEAELDQKYYAAFKEVVGVEKAAAFFRTEEEFKRVLLRQHGSKEGRDDQIPPR